MTQAYSAYGTGGRATRDNPRAAALAYFDQAPKSRKCNVTSGKTDGGFFTITYNAGGPPRRWQDVTAKGALALPDAANEADLGGGPRA